MDIDISVGLSSDQESWDVFGGSRRAERVEENAKAADILLTPEVLERVNELARPGLAEGATLV